MLLYILIIGAIIWTIQLTWKTYKVTGSVGSAFVVFLCCCGATPLVAWLLIGRDLSKV